MNNYLLEIGVEEFPSRYIDSTKKQLEDNVTSLMKEKGLGFESLRCQSTPRRFALWLNDIKELQKEDFEIVRGPSKKAAYDSEGNPGKALIGFMKSKGISLEDTYIENTGKDEYVFAKIKKDEISIPDVLADVIPKAIRKISNPRAMRWGGKNLRFLRPIRRILSIYNDQVLAFDLEGIEVGNVTSGHRFLGSGDIKIEKIDSYEEKLKKEFVIVDEEERRDIILRGLNRAAREIGGLPMEDDELMDEVVHIVEYPTVFIGKIPNEYLKLPKEVIVTPMKDHQRYFPVLDDKDNLMPFFLSVRNGNEEGIENVIKGNEKVLVPRLEDAKFFYDQDLEIKLEDYLPKLEEVKFHDELGNMLEKSERTADLVEGLGRDMECGEETMEIAERAAKLSKADLVTKMVIEFTELQGTMGKIYAEKSGEKAITAQAIGEQYMPQVSGAKLPESTAGLILSLADKIDTIAGLYAIGVEVTGSQDPFGLRRAAIGIIDIIRAESLHINLKERFRDALLIYLEQQNLIFDYDQVMEKIGDFFMGRLRTKLLEDGVRYDIIDAAFAGMSEDLLSIEEMTKAVQAYLEEGGNDLITSFVRVANMSKNYQGQDLNVEVLEDLDKEIYSSFDREATIKDNIEKGNYEQALILLDSWMKIINDYMDKTMILVDNEALKASRLFMLNRINDLILLIMDPTLIVREGDE